MEIHEKQENYSNQPYKSEKKVAAGVLGILLGGFAVHKFYLGYTKTAIIQLILSLVTCGAVGIIGIIEGIIYLTKSDEEFDRTYVQNQKEWF
ncbi:TM2 domain-containing membrane protein YozV [Chryseobacterium ginsenosidimutans]|uniref:TM2 domain-containing protein n=1 Tax=Chryseobacterium ginsenosidimutans TaxID=687846 RepID=UPI002786F19A|nr:TM2 domain-containing protein [Chryseobacterium ginsenosidimutans]MDQ0594058.1 TM2 domain-containing membrane protein YozV [Chryseobacterium ginsenosidimutans]